MGGCSVTRLIPGLGEGYDELCPACYSLGEVCLEHDEREER